MYLPIDQANKIRYNPTNREDYMDLETFKALIPAIPEMITAGISVWNNVVKPLLEKLGYNASKEQEQEMLALEEKKDTKAFTEKLEGIYKELSLNAITQSQSGDRNVQVGGNNTGPIDNSINCFIGIEKKQDEVKKN